MKGTEKQVSWAEEIRAKYAALESEIAEAVTVCESKEKPTNAHQAAAMIVSRLSDYSKYHAEDREIDAYAESLVEQGRKYMDDVYFVAKKMFFEMNLRVLRSAIATQDDARFWIDHRF